MASGSAHAAEAAEADIPTRSLLEIILAGGPTVWPILLASFVMTLVIFERLFTLRRARILPGPFIKCFFSQLAEGSLDRDEGLELCMQNESPAGRVFAAGLRKWGKPAVEVEQAVLDEGERTANVLRRYLRVLNGVATVSPLLGLLGTVSGMIQAFNDISGNSGAGKSELIAGGISEALISTAAGLLVAIPAYVFYLFFVGRVDDLVMELDRHGQQLVHMISTEALADRRNKKKAA